MICKKSVIADWNSVDTVLNDQRPLFVLEISLIFSSLSFCGDFLLADSGFLACLALRAAEGEDEGMRLQPVYVAAIDLSCKI